MKLKISDKTRRLLFTSGLVLMASVPIGRFAKDMYNNYKEEKICKDIENAIEIDVIDEIIFDDNRFHFGAYTKDDLLHAKEVTIRLTDSNDYSFLNDMINLDKLTIEDYRVLPIDEIDGTNFNNIDINIINKNITSSFSYDKYSFLKSIENINNLSLSTARQYNGYDMSGLDIESNFLDELTNVHNLKLDINYMFLYNYGDLTHLDSLELDGKPYDIAMYFSNDDLTNLKNNGVNIITDDMDTLININNKLDNIMNDLNIDANLSDKEKLDIILRYVLEHFSYDEEVSYQRKLNMEDVDYDKFYGRGTLEASLENDTQICGNYAGMMMALLHRCGIKNSMVSSNSHAWNIVLIDGKYYYVDSTILDGTGICYDCPIRYINNNGNIVEVLPNEEVSGPMVGYEMRIAVMTIPSAINNGMQDKINVLGYMDIPELDNIHTPCSIPVDAVIYNNELGNIKLDKIFGKDLKKIDFITNYAIDGTGIFICLVVVGFFSFYYDEIMEISKVKEKERTM